ncbi:Protein kinase domain [Fusarium oxysporum f. sp. vasinfectum]|nr:Protein kinase domain [Fusarium oxysporum f. sp. vasinfectum]
MTTVSDYYIQCSGSFSRLIKILDTSTRDIKQRIPLKGISNEYSRFDVWAGSVGAKHPPHKRISLDYRLRDSRFYTVRVVDILQRLDSTLNTTHQLISGERLLFENIQFKFDRQQDNDSDRSSITSSTESSSSDESDMLTPERQIAALYESIQNSVKHLYSLAMVIRQPVATDRLLRASKIPVGHFLSFDERHVDECFPDASPVLKKRLANAITRRRQLLIYNEQHYQKSSEPQPSEEVIATDYIAQDDSKDKAIEQHIRPPLAASDRIEYPAKESTGYAPTISKGSLLASTEATRFVPPLNMREEPDVQSESGTISTFGFNCKDREGFRVPPRPQDDNGEALDQFLCPLCYYLIEVKGERAWKRHVFRDLQAYVCTFDNCEAPDVLFETRQDWVQHEFENHRREWHCNDPKHNPYNSETEFIKHMKASHELQLPEPQLLSLAKLCERPSSADTVICPFCRDGYHDVTNGFECYKPSSIVRQADDFTRPESFENEELDITKLPEGSFNKTTDNTLAKVTPWVISLPNDYIIEGNSTSDPSEEPNKDQPNLAQREKCLIPSSDLKRHVGQHLERLALFALNRSKLLLDDGESAHTEDAVARSKSIFESLQFVDSVESDGNQSHGHGEGTIAIDGNSAFGDLAEFESRYQMADHVPIPLRETRQLIKETLVKSEFEHRLLESVYPDNKPLFFSPEGSLSSIITVEAVLWGFCNGVEIPSEIHSERLKRTVTYTLWRGKKLFAISVLSGFEGKSLQQAMKSFEMNAIWDKSLPLVASAFINMTNFWPDPAKPDQIESKAIDWFLNHDLERLWTDESIHIFCNNHQWKFCAPVFEETPELGRLHENYILPFTEKCNEIDEDSYGQAIKYKIHERHLELNDLAMYKPIYVTVTRLSFEPMWQRELAKLKRIQALNQRHIVKLITTFRRGEDDFYFISEASDGGNLRDFWETFPRVLTASLVKAVTQQLHGLMFASFEVSLTTALIEGGAIVSNDNLNPENIRWFKDGSGAGHKIGTMKTCHQSGATQLVSGDSLLAQLYTPPEQGVDLWNMMLHTDDMWAMGCITLEFIVWLLYGCAGLNKFHDDLKSGLLQSDPNRRFWQNSDNGSKIRHAVLEWIEHMAKDPVCRAGQTALGDLLKLTRDRLLVVNVVPRSCLGPTDFEDDSSPSRQEVGNALPIDSTDRLQKPADGPVVKTTSELWNDHRGLITKLFVQENKRLEEIKEIMKTGHSFYASTRKYQQQLDKWLFGEGSLSRRGGEQIDARSWQSESIKQHRARPKEACDWMHRILTGAKNESYWLPCAPLPPPDKASNYR